MREPNWVFKVKMYAGVVLILLVPILMVLGVVFIGSDITRDSGKYIIYAAQRTYRTNNFQTYGRTIYFKDVNNKNVCITGDYTLIYEKDISEE